MDGELHRKIKDANSLYEKYVQMMDEHVVKKIGWIMISIEES